MRRIFIRHIPVFTAVAVVAWAVAAGDALASGHLTRVKVTPDLRRVIVTCDGQMSAHGTFAIDPPSRLIIDVPGTRLGDVLRKTRYGKGSGLTVEVRETKAGARIVLDFGGASVPEHRIERLGNCLMVLFKEWTPQSAGSSRSASADKHKPARTHVTPPRHAASKAQRSVEVTDLRVESAEVVNGLIVLKVASKEAPDITYRIDLGINLDRLGFSSASIRPIRDGRTAARRSSPGGSHMAGSRTPEKMAAPRAQADTPTNVSRGTSARATSRVSNSGGAGAEFRKFMVSRVAQQ